MAARIGLSTLPSDHDPQYLASVLIELLSAHRRHLAALLPRGVGFCYSRPT
jgi:hypothetical protein